MAQKTEGFSGADLAELCQRAAKAAIRDVSEYFHHCSNHLNGLGDR